MANYPSPPGLRVPYDRDGSAGVRYGDIAIVNLSNTTMTAMNADNAGNIALDGGTNFNGGGTVAVVFSELWDIVGYFLGVGLQVGGTITNIQYSLNTTSGQDGTWTAFSTVAFTTLNGSSGAPVLATYRSNITSVTTVNAVKGIRCVAGSGGGAFVGMAAFDFYGTPTVVGSAAASTDQLFPWHPTLNQPADGTTADFGDISRGSTLTKQFRIKNNSTKTAHSITVAEETLFDTTPSLLPQFTFSTDNTNFFSTINIGDLTAGAISSIIYWKDSVASNATLSVWDLRAVATASSFS